MRNKRLEIDIHKRKLLVGFDTTTHGRVKTLQKIMFVSANLKIIIATLF